MINRRVMIVFAMPIQAKSLGPIGVKMLLMAWGIEYEYEFVRDNFDGTVDIRCVNQEIIYLQDDSDEGTYASISLGAEYPITINKGRWENPEFFCNVDEWNRRFLDDLVD